MNCAISSLTLRMRESDIEVADNFLEAGRFDLFQCLGDARWGAEKSGVFSQIFESDLVQAFVRIL
jgi:hypothetical protein